MPSVQRRVTPKGKIRFRAMVRVKDHKTKTATFLKRTDASLWAQETELRLRQCKYFPNKLIESEKYTLGDLLDRYQSEVLPKKKAKGQPGQLKWWKNQLGGRKLKNIYPALISTYKEKLIQEPSERTGRKRTPATVNRYLALLSHACTIAIKEWQWMAVNPVIQISKPKEAQGRTRFLSDEERERLLVACRSSESTHLFTIVTLALSTGMRRGEILGLSNDSNLDIWLSYRTPLDIYKMRQLSELAYSRNGRILSRDYIGVNGQYEWQCFKHGLIWPAKANDVKNGKTWCKTCGYEKVSKAMRKLRKGKTRKKVTN
tara:strand:+ start:60 stop:1007 length:948 start_codon:yes stop_codon:yes gene_type:complete